MITHHTQLLNALIEKYNLKSYLEIGVQNPANNFDKIKCERKIGIDPEIESNVIENNTGRHHLLNITSDDFFNDIYNEPDCKYSPSLIFIDGLHTADQVKRDFENSLRCLSDNGFIVIHDVLPENEAGTKVPRETKQWWGDVYKWAMTIDTYSGIKYKTFNIDNGCMLICKDPASIPKSSSHTPLDGNWWAVYKIKGFSLMNVTPTVEI